MHTASDIISLWPSREALAADIGVDLSAVHSWVKRRRIAAGHDMALIAAARRRGILLSLEDLVSHRKPVKRKNRHSAQGSQATACGKPATEALT